VKTAAQVIADTYIKDFGHHLMAGPTSEILEALDRAGYKIVQKDETEQMLDRVKTHVR
jgi:hypothetical protein